MNETLPQLAGIPVELTDAAGFVLYGRPEEGDEGAWRGPIPVYKGTRMYRVFSKPGVRRFTSGGIVYEKRKS